MKRVLPLLLLVVPQLAQSQWVEVQKGELVIRGGWLFDSVSDERRPNSGIVFLANGVTSTWSAGEMKILIGQAHKRGMTTAAHFSNYNVEYDVDLRDAILCGQPKARSAQWGRTIMLNGSLRSGHYGETRYRSVHSPAANGPIDNLIRVIKGHLH